MVTDMKFTKKEIINLSLLLFLFTFIVNLNSISNLFAFDDHGLILENKYSVEGTDFIEIFTHNYRFGAGKTSDGLYRPLANLTYVINTKGDPPDPKPFHLFNVIINALNSVLLFFVFMNLFKNPGLSFISALIFALHPIHSESVANIAGRPEILFTLFLLSSWLAFNLLKNIYLSAIISSIILFLGLLSKETAIVFPFILISIDFILKKSVFNKKYALKILILCSSILLYMLIRWLVLGSSSMGNPPKFIDNPIAASDPIERISTALAVMLKYITLLIAPVKFSSDYSYFSIPIYKNPFNAMTIISVLFTTLAIIFSFVKRKVFPELLIGIIIFIFPYLLISNIIFPIGTIMGERFMYLPSAGVSLILGTVLLKIRSNNKKIGTIIIIVLLCAFSFKSYTRNADWYDDNTITKKDLSSYPMNVKLLVNNGIISAKNGDYSTAEKYYKKALEIYPDFNDANTAYGKLNYDRGNYPESIKYYSSAIEIEPYNKQIIFDYAMVLINSGNIYDAEKFLEEKIKILPESPQIYQAYGFLKMNEQKFNEAINYYEKALSLGGNQQIMLNNMAAAAVYMEDFSLAYSFVERAEKAGIRLNPEMIEVIKKQLYLK
jgi:protein O-mannosyl-transferase